MEGRIVPKGDITNEYIMLPKTLMTNVHEKIILSVHLREEGLRTEVG
jgi:hypothetical protein